MVNIIMTVYVNELVQKIEAQKTLCYQVLPAVPPCFSPKVL